jgi:hypothetical protein
VFENESSCTALFNDRAPLDHDHWCPLSAWRRRCSQYGHAKFMHLCRCLKSASRMQHDRGLQLLMPLKTTLATSVALLAAQARCAVKHGCQLTLWH